MAAALSPELLEAIRGAVKAEIQHEDPLFAHGGARHSRGLLSNHYSGVDSSSLSGTAAQVDASGNVVSVPIYDNGFASADSVNVFWLLICGYLVFLMQLGFAMLCAGLVRYKNANNIMLKNILDASVGSICWYVLGYGFAYGISNHRSNAFIGNHDFGLTYTTKANWFMAWPQDTHDYVTAGNYAGYFFQWAFAATAATIVSGAVAERCTFIAYLSYSIYMASFVYPVVVHACWSGIGWLSPWVGNGTAVETNGGRENGDSGDFTFAGHWNGGAAILNTGAYDFAGSGVVHMTGGVAALVGATMLGPRLGRFRDGKVNDEMSGSSTVLVVLGTLILWFGWYGFNPGSQLAIAGVVDGAVAGRCAVCTTLSAGAGGVTALLFRFWRSGAFEVVYTCNGVLAGLVGVTASCSLIEPWAAIICGVFAALTMYGAECALHALQIDDPVSAFPVHGAAGMYALIFTGFFTKHDYAKEVYGYPVSSRRYGWFYGGHGQVMLSEIVELFFILCWVGINFFLLFGLLKITGRLRVPPEVEHAGHEASVHGSKKGTSGNIFGGGMESNGMDLTVDTVKPSNNTASPKGEGVEETPVQPGTSAV
uniref:Ammonium transporter n=1 Tax=Dunaliella viridis TaxID=140095 RepID=E9KJL3_9CHLO|nr:ammonium transporter 1;1 [Dunaliella viridis]